MISVEHRGEEERERDGKSSTRGERETRTERYKCEKEEDRRALEGSVPSRLEWIFSDQTVQ